MEKERNTDDNDRTAEQPLIPDLDQVTSEVIVSNSADQQNAPGPMITKAPYPKGLAIALLIGFVLLVVLVIISLIFRIPELFGNSSSTITS